MGLVVMLDLLLAQDGDTVDLVLDVLRRREIQTLDLTGGAPELNMHFRRLVAAARARAPARSLPSDG